MRKFLGIVCSLVLILVAGVTFAACGKQDAKVSISASELEIELVIGTEKQSKDVEFLVENFGNGSGQVNFSVEENEKNIVSLESSYLNNGKTKLTVTGLKRGTARIVATSLQGSAKVVLTVKVVQPITGLKLKNEYVNKLYAITGESLNLAQEEIWNFMPSETNQRDLAFSIIGNSQGCEIQDGKLVVANNCVLSSVTIRATSAFNSEISAEFEVKILNPIEVVMQIDGKRVVEKVENSSQILNFIEIFPRELDGSIYPNSKEVVLAVKAGNETETLNINKVFFSTEEKFSVQQTAYSYDAASKIHIYKFLIQANSNDAGKIDAVSFKVSYEGFKAGQDDYSVSSVKLNLSSYNKPISVEVNGESGTTEIDVFENSINFSNGKLIEISLLPGNIKPSENTITIWAEDFSNLPISLYKLNATRTGYVCVFGFDQKGNAVGAVQNGIRYATISSGTKLYAFINSNYNSLVGTNKAAKMYAQATDFCKFTVDSTSRALTTMNFVINPNAKSISLAEMNDENILTRVESTTIFVEIGKKVTKYIAIDPNTFTIGSNSVIKIANSKIATIGQLVEFASDENYTYGKFEIEATRVGSSTLTVVLSDGKTKEFKIVVVSPLEKLDMNLEDITFGGTVIESDIVPYKNITDTEVVVGENNAFVALNKLSIANSGGSGIQLIKTPTPSTAQYYLSYKFADFTMPEGETLQTLTLSKVKDSLGEENFENVWNDSSDIINTSRLSNLSIIEAKNSGAEGNVLVKVAVYAMNSNGEYGDEPVGYFYYLINFFVPVKGLSLNNGTLELYTYNTIGDKFVDKNGINKSIGSFSVTVNPVNQGLTPTYLNSLEVYVNGRTRLTNDLFEQNENVILLSKGGTIVSSLENTALKIVRTKVNNTFTFQIQAFSGEGTYIFALVLSEINEAKRFTAISRVVVSEAVEISDIDVVNASEKDPIQFNNIIKTSESGEQDEKEAVNNPFELELIYNIYGPSGKEITNSSLEFELSWKTLAAGESFVDENGNRVNFASISNGKIKILRAAYDYSDFYNLSEEEREGKDKEEYKKFVVFGGEGSLRIYPTSNYFLSTSGWNGEDPIVEIPIFVSDGTNIAFYITKADDLNLLGQYPNSSFELRTNIAGEPQNYIPVEKFSGKLFGANGSSYYILTTKPLFKQLTSSAVVENFYYANVTSGFSSEDCLSIKEMLELRSTVDGTTYYGGLANINEGTIRNISGALSIATEDDPLIIGLAAATTTIANKATDLLDMSLSVLTVNKNNAINQKGLFDSASQFIAGELVKYTGGLVGLNKGVIEGKDGLYYTGSVMGANAGGIAGVNDGIIRNYEFYGCVYGAETAGGIVALNSGNITNCNVLTLSLFNIAVYTLNKKAYDYSKTTIDFAVGGIAAISNGGTIFRSKVEASSNSDFNLGGFGGIIDVEKVDKEIYRTINGKAIGKGNVTATYSLDQSTFKFNDIEYTIDDLSNPTKLTYTLNNENKEIAIVENRFTIGNASFQLSGTDIYASADFATKTIYGGGLVGILGKDASLKECIFNGSISVNNIVSGGFVGKLPANKGNANSRVQDCYAIARYEETSENNSTINGQFIGIGELSEIKNSYVVSNGTFGYAGQGTGTLVSSYLKRQNPDYSSLLNIDDVFNKNSSFGSGSSSYDTIDLKYGLTLGSFVNMSWYNLYQTGYLSYATAINGEDVVLTVNVKMGVGEDGTAEFEKNFMFNLKTNTSQGNITSETFTFRGINYNIVIEDDSSYCNLIVRANNTEIMNIQEGTTSSGKVQVSKTEAKIVENLVFRSNEIIDKLKDATNTAYFRFVFEETLEQEGQVYTITPSVSVLDILYAKYYYIWVYNNFDALYANKDFISAIGGEDGITFEELMGNIFGISETLTVTELKERIKTIVEGTILPQFVSGFETLKEDVANYRTKFGTAKTAFVKFIRDYYPEKLTDVENEFSLAETLLEQGSAMLNIESATLENVSTIKSCLDLILSSISKTVNAFFENVPENGEHEVDFDVLLLFYDIYYAQMLNGSIGNFAYTLKVVEATFKELNMPSTLEEFQNAGWDIAGEDEDSNSTWTFKDGELPLLRNKKLTQRISSYGLAFKENNKLFRSKIDGAGNMNLLLFNYSVLGELTAEQEAKLHDLNSLNISDVFSFKNINGEGEGTVEQFVISSNKKSVIQIIGGKIQIVGTGEATLTISPLYKSFDISGESLEKKITVYVVNPIGNVQIFQGVSEKTNPINNETIFIYKNELNYITISEKTTISLANTVFNFVRNAMAYDIGRDGVFEILGLTAGADEGRFAEGTLTIKPGDGAIITDPYEFIVKTLLQTQNQNFKNVSDLTTFIKSVNEILEQYSENFFANVSIKADRILISIKEAEMDPSSVVSVDSELQTSNEEDELLIVLRDENGNVIWVSKDIKIGDVEYKVQNNSNIFEIISNSSAYQDGKIVNKTLISIREDVRNTIVKTSIYTVTFSDSSLEKTSTLQLKLKPQEILNVTYVHNNRTEDSTENGIKIQDEPSSVLMPGDSGLLSIGLYPTYANFSRIVLTSNLVDGQNYILLEQMYKSGQYYLPVSSTTGYLSVRDGNVLTITKPSDPALVENGNIYVRTKMLETVNEGLYFPINITIYALDENGNEYVAKSETITLLSETIDGAQITINGGKDATLARGNTYPIRISVNQSQTLSRFYLSNLEGDSQNVNDFVALYFNTAEYEIENNRKVYSGTITIGLDAELKGDGVFNVQTVVSKMINGKLESTTDSVEIRVVDFLVEGIKIKGNADGDNVFNTPAAIEKDLNFEFIFSKTPEKTSSEQESSFERIENGKKEFVNSVSFKQFFKNEFEGKEKNYQYVINTDRDFKVNPNYNEIEKKNNPTHISTTNCSIAHDLYFTSDMTPYINSITGETQENQYFSIKYNGDKNSTNIDATTLKITGKSVGGVNMTIKIGYRVPGLDYDQYITYNFVVNVQVYSDEDKPTPIENAGQFVEYLTSGGNQYASTNFILMNDIVLENFTPFETTNFASLDGNNKVITIKNFNIPTGNSVNLGLFVAVANNSTVKNLVVNYGQLADIIVPTSVTNFNFGGLAITNSGTIYNCEVVSLDLESVENSPSSNAGIRIYFGSEGKQKADNVSSQIAGFVVNNNSSITNSRVGAKTIFRENGVAVVEGFKHISYVDDKVKTEVFNYGAFNIIGQGNMSGFVITNNGVIAASYFANGKIVNQTTSGSLSETAGFVVVNNMEGTIFGSFVEGIKLNSDTSVNITGGGIVAQGISAGFAYENYGSISDCYTNIRLAGESTGRIVSGFVYNNHTSGKVARCYSASTIVGQLTTQMPFSGKNARDEIMQNAEDGLVNCYYLVKKQDTESVLEEKYNTGAIALQISTLRSDTFYGLTLTTKKNGNDGVWAWDGLLPQLVSANQKAISVRRVIKNYSSLVSGGSSIENINIYPYIPGYEYGSQANPIIIRSADEFNRVFGQETGLVKNAYYAISQMYNKEIGIVFGSYRLVASIDFDSLTYVENVKISSSIMDLARNGSVNFGTFDGNALTIANVEVSLDNQSSVGLFSRITGGGVFKNATLTVKSVTTGQNGIYAGAVAGYVSNSSLANITVEPVTATGEGRSKISGQNIVGGVVGAVVGNSTVSNLVSSISVISGNAQAKRDLNNYILNVLRSSATVVNGVLTDRNREYSFAGGVIGLLDIYEDLNDQSVVSSLPNAKQLTFIGNEVSVQGSIVGGVVGYNGASTYLVDSAFVLKGSEDSLNQRLITYENTIGGVVGVNKGDLFELRIEHDNSIQKKIEDNLQGYYNNESEIFRGNTKLFNSIGTGTNEIYAGGLVGQMLGGNITVSYSRVDVALNKAIAGGVIGFTNTRLDLIEIYAFGDVDGEIAGGIIGRANAAVSFERCVAINFISKTNSHLIGAINAANSGTTPQQGTDGAWTIENDGVTYNIQLDETTGKIVAIEMNGFGTLIGDQKNSEVKYIISEEVYANDFITYKQLQVKFNKGEKEEKSLAPDGLTLDGGLSSYRGYDYDASVINKMFLGADWDASLWELKDGRIFPSFSYGVSTKTIYIEKPKDILKLKKYYKGDNIVIFGDDPTTSFNPYEYNPADKNTWGTFTATELAGLSIDKESRKLIFDISVIKSQVSLGDGGTYFQRFLGVMYGELAAAEENSEWIYELTNIERPLFNVVKGGSISGLSFNLKKGSDKGTIQSAVLANTISGRADLNNLQFSNIKLEPATKIGSEGKSASAGIIASTMEDVMSISNITITNCEIEINNISDALYIGAIAGKNNTTSISYVKINNVKIENLTITANSGISGALNVGGMFGETSGIYDFKNSQVTDSSLNVGLAKQDGKENFEAGQEIFVGGFVGKAQGNSTVHKFDNNNTNLTEVTITIDEAATTYAGLLFGSVGTLITNKDDNPSFQGTIQNAVDNETKKPTTLVIGGAAGSAGNAKIFGMVANLTVSDLATKTFTGETSTIISSVGSVFGYVGEATIGEGNNNNEIRYYKNITITGSDSSESNNAIAIGGLIGRATGKLTLSNSGYYGDLTIRYTATTRYIGGLVGRVEGELKLDEVAFGESKDGSTTGSIKIERVDGKDNGDNKPCDSSATYVGGLVGFAKEKATITNASVTGDISFPATLEDKTPIAIGANSTVNVGLIAGVLTNKGENEIKNAQVGGDIFFGNATIQGTINAGALVGTFNGGTISGSYAWGNVELKNAKLLNGGKFEIDVLTVGGLVGNVGGATTLSSNYSLTSMYITRLASLDKTNINALVGTGASSVTATKDGDTETNFYCHQINLATDTIGQNLYYQSGKVAGLFAPILTKLNENDFIKGLKAGEGSKLNPIDYYGGATEEGKYYYLSSSSINESKELKGHLVGDGKTLRSNNLTPFNLITGAVSGIGFVVTSQKEGTNAGRVRGNEFEEEYLPSGVAYENKGIIFAVNVYAKGFTGTNAGFGNVLYSFNAGIAQYNSGLISDSGVVFNVKSLYAGLVSICGTQGTPTNGNEGTPGVIKNSYATGAVHEKAEYALADCRSLTKGVIQNCYSAIDSKNCIYQDFVAENCFYDNNAAKNAYNVSISGLTAKSTDELSTVNTEETNILKNEINGENNTERLTGNNNWKQDFRVNFGYPYLGENAYSGFDYLRYNTGGSSGYSSIISISEIDNPQKYQPKLEYIRSYGLNKNWKLYSIYLGDRLGYYGKYIWINDGAYKFVDLSSTPPSFSETGNVTLSFSIIDYFGRSIILDFKIDTKKVSIEVSDVKNQYIQIPNAGKLAQLQTRAEAEFNSWAQKYILLSNIDLSAFFDNIEGEESKKWKSIGTTETDAFKGVFDGNNYKIYNIPEFESTNTRVGFFGYLNGGTIQNCGFIYKDGTTLKSTQDVGGVVGRIENGSVNNVSSSGATVSDDENNDNSYGGLVGSIAKGTISNSSNYNTVSANNNAGGIVGDANGTNSITGCNNFGVIEKASRSAGIVGQLVSSKEISNCRNYGKVSGTSAGGIVGEQQGSTISNSQNYGSINGTTNAGGIVGQAGKTVKQIYSETSNYGESKVIVANMMYIWPNFSNENEFKEKRLSKFEIDGQKYAFVIKVTKRDGKKVQVLLGITSQHSKARVEDSEIWEVSNKKMQSDYIDINEDGGIGTWEFSFDLGEIRYFGNIKIQIIGTANRNVKPISAEIYSFNNSQETFVNNSFNSGEIKGSKYAGGIVGRLTTNEAINGSRNDGNVSANNSTQCFAGGIVGGTYPGGNHNVGKIESCANTGKISASGNNSWVGKIGNDVATITSCYGGGETNGTTNNDYNRNGNEGVTSIPKGCASSDKKWWFDEKNIVLPKYNEERNSYLIENNEQFVGMGYQLISDSINLGFGLAFGDNEEIEIRGYESNKIELVRNLDLSGKLSLFGANNIKDLTIFVKYNEKGYEIGKSFIIQDLNANNLNCLIDSSGRLTIISNTSTKQYITSKGKNGGAVFSKVSGETNFSLEFAYILDETNNTIKIYVNKQVEFCQNGYQIFFESTDA
ncbi:MAG: hypothetical protein SPF37_02120 [Eubacteriales bacterium]|nr:hypothetical protein [Eubacteriales bacterium]